MKNTIKIGVLLMVGLLLAGCGNAFHNGTQLTLAKVTVKGLPASVYPAGKKMIFDLCLDLVANTWVHSTSSLLTSPTSIYLGTMASDGSVEFNFSPPLVISSGDVKFLIVDANDPPSWNTVKIDKKHSGKNGGDVVLANPWSTANILGVVSGDDVNWSFE